MLLQIVIVLVAKLCSTSWTITLQAPLSMGFPRQEYWSGWPCPATGDLPNPEGKSVPSALAGRFFTTPLSHLESLYIYISLSSFDGHLICFHVLIIVNSTAMDGHGVMRA